MSFTLALLSLGFLISTATCQLLTAVERAHILEAHLEVRENVSPPASNMLLMQYSKKMEDLAAYWASLCVFEHPNPLRYPQFRGIGQNLALHSGFKPHVTDSVCGWKRESKFYNFINNTCSHVCGHYTQLVWANSNRVGCVIRQCDGLIPEWDNPQYLTVCQYKPGGNYIGHRPYDSGRSCSRCPRGYSCHRKQCVRRYRSEDVYPITKLKKANNTSLPECRSTSFFSVIEYN